MEETVRELNALEFAFTVESVLFFFRTLEVAGYKVIVADGDRWVADEFGNRLEADQVKDVARILSVVRQHAPSAIWVMENAGLDTPDGDEAGAAFAEAYERHIADGW